MRRICGCWLALVLLPFRFYGLSMADHGGARERRPTGQAEAGGGLDPIDQGGRRGAALLDRYVRCLWARETLKRLCRILGCVSRRFWD